MLLRYIEDDGSVSKIPIQHRPIFPGYYKKDGEFVQTPYYIPYEAAQDIHLCFSVAQYELSKKTLAIIKKLHPCLGEMTIDDLKQVLANFDRPHDKAMLTNEVDARWARRQVKIRKAESEAKA